MVKRFWRAETGIFPGIWLFLMIAGRSQMFRDPGTFWHTIVGRRILSSRCFIDADPFSFTFGGRPWVPYEWLGECAMAVLDGFGGLDSLLLASATVLAGLYTWLAYRLMRRGLHWLPTAFIVMLTVAASANHLHVRPHIGTIVFFGLTYGLLCDFESDRIGLGRLCWIVPLFVVWSNLHGGALGGMATVGLAVAGWTLAWLVGLESPIMRFRQVPLLILLSVACVLASLVNPYGFGLPRTWLEIMRSPVIPRIIQEHAPLDVRSPDGWLILLLGLMYAGAVASVRPWKPRVTWLLPFFWFYEALTRVRHAPLFSIAAALALAEMLPTTRWATWLACPGRDWFDFPSGDRLPERRLGWRPAVLPLAVVLTAIVLQGAGIRAPIVGRGWVRLDPDHWPVDLLPELRQAERDHPEGARVFNDYLYGGFLIYYTPGLKVFIDDRCELYGDDWLAQFWESMQGNSWPIESWDNRYHFDFALVHSRSAFERYFDQAPDWAIVKRTDAATLYRRRTKGAGVSSAI
jgi:hypothetical protein